MIPFSAVTDVPTATSGSKEELGSEEANPEDIQGTPVRNLAVLEGFSDDLIFQTADLQMVDVSLWQKSIESVLLNRYRIVDVSHLGGFSLKSYNSTHWPSAPNIRCA